MKYNQLSIIPLSLLYTYEELDEASFQASFQAAFQSSSKMTGKIKARMHRFTCPECEEENDVGIFKCVFYTLRAI